MWDFVIPTLGTKTNKPAFFAWSIVFRGYALYYVDFNGDWKAV